MRPGGQMCFLAIQNREGTIGQLFSLQHSENEGGCVVHLLFFYLYFSIYNLLYTFEHRIFVVF